MHNEVHLNMNESVNEVHHKENIQKTFNEDNDTVILFTRQFVNPKQTCKGTLESQDRHKTKKIGPIRSKERIS